MQIEEGFRDTKSVAYGLGIANGRHAAFMRAAHLLLIAALAGRGLAPLTAPLTAFAWWRLASTATMWSASSVCWPAAAAIYFAFMRALEPSRH